MARKWSDHRRSFARAMVAAWATITPNAVVAQVVMPRTVPVQQSGQFDIFPSRLSGAAGVSLALDDTLLDPFVNPAKAVRVRGGLMFGVPGVHSISSGGGGGRTFPVGTLFSRGSWAGGALVAGQHVDHARGQPLAEKETASNRYLSALIARRFGRGVSIGASGYWAALDGLDGLDLLYSGSTHVAMTGKQVDLRAGLLKEWAPGRSVELLLLYGRSDMSHDVEFPVPSWDPNTRSFTNVPRYEHNDDRTRYVGVHSEMTIPTDTLGSRVGFLLTANHLDHPKIPNYPLANLPRDPGGTYAFNLGFGYGQALGPTAVGVDIIYEPMWSHTWAEAASDVATDAGMVIPVGRRTVENRFHFSNIKLRGGFSREFQSAADSTLHVRIQAGLAVFVNHYGLRQQNHVLITERKQFFNWTEWGPTLGISVRARRLEIGYSLQLTCAPGSCNPFPAGDDVAVAAPTPGAGGVIAPPSAAGGPTDAGYGRTLTHRFTITLPRH